MYYIHRQACITLVPILFMKLAFILVVLSNIGIKEDDHHQHISFVHPISGPSVQLTGKKCYISKVCYCEYCLLRT